MSIKNRGFTLIELLVVISIISLLSSIVFTTLSGAKIRARNAVRISDVKEIAKAFQMISYDNDGNYPSSGGAGKCLGANGTCWNGSSSTLSGDTSLNNLLLNFMSKIPADPSGRSGVGDRYIYADQTTLVNYHCSASTSSGPFILWQPEIIRPNATDSECLNVGYYACCGSITCDYFCAYKIE